MFEKLKNTIDHYTSELKLIIQLSLDNPELSAKIENVNIDRFLQMIQRHKLSSFLYKNIETQKEEVPKAFMVALKQKHSQNTRKNMKSAREIIALSQKFQNQNLPYLLLKGPVLAQMLYDDPFLKNSIDIDILTSFEHLEAIHKILLQSGYEMIYPTFRLNTTQQKINYKISHHYNFRHPEKGVQIELHWKLMNPQILLPLSFTELYNRSVSVGLNEYEAQTLSKKDYLLYLAVHGSKHRWYSLGWLKDFSQLLHNTPENAFTETIEQVKHLGLTKPFVQSCVLAHLFFENPVNEQVINLYKEEKNMDRFILHAMKAIETPMEKIKADKGGRLSYQFKLRKSLRYKGTLLFRLRTHHSDWELLRLPGWLFFLYYPLRPFLFLYRILRGGFHGNG